MKRILREDHVKLLLNVLTVLFLGLCILFSGGVYESMGRVFPQGSEHNGRAVAIEATLNKFTGEIRINKVVCDAQRERIPELISLSSKWDFCKAYDITYPTEQYE